MPTSKANFDYIAGKTMRATIRRSADGFLRNATSGSFAADIAANWSAALHVAAAIATGSATYSIDNASLTGTALAADELIVDAFYESTAAHGSASLGQVAGRWLGTVFADDGAVVIAIQAKTDQLTFTTANVVDASGGGGGSLTAADVWAAATRTLTGGAAIITGDIEFTAKQIVRGNDYSSANQPWAESMSSSSITDLSAYAWVFTADKDADNLETGDATFAGTVVVTTATGSSRALRIDVAASLTDSLAKGYYNGAIRGTATSGSKLATPKFISVKVVDDPNQ